MVDEQDRSPEQAMTDAEQQLDVGAPAVRAEDQVTDGSSEDANGDLAGHPSSPNWSAPEDRPAEEQSAYEEAVEEKALDEVEEETATAEGMPEESSEAAAVEEAAPTPPKVPAKPKAAKPKAPPEVVKMDWYILKVQSNRERTVAEALQRKVAIEGLDHYFGQIIVPTEKVTEFKGGKKKIVERTLYPGYIMVQMHINDTTWFAVRETSGVGDFTGAGGKPTPMLAHEVARIVQSEEEETAEAPKLNIQFQPGERVKVKEGNFEGFEGEVGTIDAASGRVTVMINTFGRSTPVELEYWQIESV